MISLLLLLAFEIALWLGWVSLRRWRPDDDSSDGGSPPPPPDPEVPRSPRRGRVAPSRGPVANRSRTRRPVRA